MQIQHLIRDNATESKAWKTLCCGKGETVVDCFGGSGTAIFAAEETARTAAVMEVDPTYCAKILQRWEILTGDKPKLEKSHGNAPLL
jgi:DNA modification methylase